MPTLLITGANRGLGLEFTRQYLADKWDVIAACRDPAKASELHDLAKVYPALRIETLDVADHASIISLAKRLDDVAIDILINNAGIISGAHATTGVRNADPSQVFGTLDPDAWSRVLAVNTISPVMMTQEFMPHLIHGAHKKIVNVSSKMGSIAGMANDHIAYRTSKAALNAAMRVIVSDLREKDIATVNFHPGWVKTDMGSDAAPLAPADSVTGMRKIIAALRLKDTGQFIGYDGMIIAW